MDRASRTRVTPPPVVSKRHAIATLLAVFAVAATGCGPVARSEPRLVLLYAPCSVGKKFLSPWNDSVSYTPNLARFARESIVFERHQTETGQSGIAYASILSGSQADHHGVYRHPAVLADDLYLISEAYADAGYETFFWNGHPMTRDELNYAQGVPDENHFSKALLADDPRFVEILEQLERDPEYKAFVVTNMATTHGPYKRAPVARFVLEHPTDTLEVTRAELRRFGDLYHDNYFGLTWNHTATLQKLGISAALPTLSRVIELLYRANISHLDHLFGNVLDAITRKGLMPESLIVFTADHGEVLYRDSATFKWTHSMLLDHEVLGVPLMIHAPGIAAGRYAGVTRSIDVFPTMAGLSNILPHDRGTQGVDLSRVLSGDEPTPELLAYSHTTVLVEKVFRQMYQPRYQHNWLEARKFFPDDDVRHIWVAVRSGDEWFKYRKLEDGSWATQAFDLAADPDANHDIFDSNPSRHVAIRDQLIAYKSMLIRAYEQSHDRTGKHRLSDEQEQEMLRGLGYIQ